MGAIEGAGDAGFWLDFALSVLRMATPLMLAALGGVLSEKAGVVNLALEGQMLVGAFLAALFAHQVQLLPALGSFMGPAWVGWWAGGLAGMVLALILGFLTITCHAQQIVTGTGLNMLAMGLCPVLAFGIYGASGSTPSLDMGARLTWEPTLVALSLPLLLAAFFRWTKGGLWVKVAGENPLVLLSSGLSPAKVRYGAVLLSGLFAGWGGASLSLALSSSYSRDMTAGRGFIALAAVVLGRWHPLGAMAACLLFGATEAMQMRLQATAIFVPPALIQIFPYGVTLLVLALGVGRMKPPRALGQGLRL